jgi:Protein of unknown function (DUF3768)
MTDSQKSARIAELNNQLRRGDSAVSNRLGSVIMTPGVVALDQIEQVLITTALLTHDFCQHDFGSLKVFGKIIFWKIAYYDRATYGTDAQRGSDDPSDPEQTYRLLTIMLAEEF